MDHPPLQLRHPLPMEALRDLVQAQTLTVAHLVAALYHLAVAIPMDLPLLLLPQSRLTVAEAVVAQSHPHLHMEALLVQLQALAHTVAHHLHPVRRLVTLTEALLRHHLLLTAVHLVLSQAAVAQTHMVALLVVVVQVILITAHLPQTQFQYIIHKATKSS
jgi:hypothetical protein